MLKESQMKSDIQVGDRVRVWSQFHTQYQRGTVIGLHTDNIGIDPSGDEMATVRFDESAGTGVTDVAIKRYRLERVC